MKDFVTVDPVDHHIIKQAFEDIKNACESELFFGYEKIHYIQDTVHKAMVAVFNEPCNEPECEFHEQSAN